MNSTKLSVVLLLLLAVSSAKLLFVSEMYRHGARGALSPFYDGRNQSSIAGQLTGTGQRQHYNLGKILRQEYIENQQFMPPTFNHSLIYVRSDDVDRTIMSAASHFQGFYPETFGAQIPLTLPHQYTLPPFEGQGSSINQEKVEETIVDYALPHGIQVLPIHVVEANVDYEFLSSDLCLNYKTFTATHIAENLKVSKFVDSKMAGTYVELSAIFNQTIAGWIATEGLHDVVVADWFNGRKVPFIPEKTKKAFEFLDNFYWTFMQSGSIRAVRLITTKMMQDIFSKFDAAISNSTSLKWLSLSGHDSNVAPLLRLLNFTDYQCLIDNYFYQNSTALNCAPRPAFAASVIFELHEDDEDSSQNYVKVRYNGEYMNLCEKQSTVCDYNEFKNRIEINFPKNFALECLNENVIIDVIEGIYNSKNNSPSNLSSIFSTESDSLMIYALAAQVLLFALFYLYNRKSKQTRVSQYDNQQYLYQQSLQINSQLMNQNNA